MSAGTRAQAKDSAETIPDRVIDAPMFEGGEGIAFFKTCAREFERLRPGVKINLYGDPRVDTRIRIQVIDRRPPSFSNASLNHYAMIEKGQYLSIEHVLDGPDWNAKQRWRDTFISGLFEPYQVQGKEYGLPFTFSPTLFWYNKVLFMEHGWEIPSSYEELFRLCDRIKQAGLAPVAFQGRAFGYAWPLVDSLVYHLGGERALMSTRNLDPAAFQSLQYTQALTYLQRLAREGFQSGCMGMSHTEAQMQFFLGKAAMITCGAWLVSEMGDKIPDHFQLGAFNLPGVEHEMGDPTALFSGSNYFFVYANGPETQLSIDFLRYLTSSDVATRFVRERKMPAAVAVANGIGLSGNMSDLAALIRGARKAYVVNTQIPDPRIQEAANDQLFALLSLKTTPLAMAREMERVAAKSVNTPAKRPPPASQALWLSAACVLLLATGSYLFRSRTKAALAREYSGIHPEAAVRMGSLPLAMFLAPAVVLYSAFVIWPALQALRISCFAWDGITEGYFVGLAHFKSLLLNDPYFWRALMNNVFVTVIPSMITLPLAMYFAFWLSQSIRGSGVYRFCFLFPNIMGSVAATLLWLHIYNPQGGLINSGLEHLSRVLLTHSPAHTLGTFMARTADFAWLSQEHLYASIIPIMIWANTGFYMLLIYAAMRNVPTSYYEAADLEGATLWQKFRHITVHLIWDMLLLCILFSVIGGMKAFEIVWLLTNQQPVRVNHLLSTLMLHQLFVEMDGGRATAVAVLLFLITLAISLIFRRLMRCEAVEL